MWLSDERESVSERAKAWGGVGVSLNGGGLLARSQGSRAISV